MSKQSGVRFAFATCSAHCLLFIILRSSRVPTAAFVTRTLGTGREPRKRRQLPLPNHGLTISRKGIGHDDAAVVDTPVSDSQQRRSILCSFLALSQGLLLSTKAFASETSSNIPVQEQQQKDTACESITVPLHWIPSLSAYVVYYSVGGKERFGAIVDTGSPFLVVPNYCDKQKYGCYLPEQSRPSGLPPTLERFDNNEGEVEWRTAPFSFIGASGSMMGPSEMVFGVASESLMNGPGGVFMGLIRDTDAWIRPSFLGQTPVKSMVIDLRGETQDNNATKTLTLSSQSFNLFCDDFYIPLVRDLNRKFGDPVIHYTARASDFTVNGISVLPKGDRKPIYVIFDTGVTGMVVSRELFDQRYTDARRNKEKSLWGSVEIAFQTRNNKRRGNTNKDQTQKTLLSARKPVTTPLGMKPWPKFNNAHLIVLGLAFLDGQRIAIDMDGQRLQLQN